MAATPPPWRGMAVAVWALAPPPWGAAFSRSPHCTSWAAPAAAPRGGACHGDWWRGQLRGRRSAAPLRRPRPGSPSRPPWPRSSPWQRWVEALTRRAHWPANGTRPSGVQTPSSHSVALPKLTLTSSGSAHAEESRERPLPGPLLLGMRAQRLRNGPSRLGSPDPQRLPTGGGR